MQYAKSPPIPGRKIHPTDHVELKALRTRRAPKLGAIGKELQGWSFAEVAKLEAGETISLCDEDIALADVLLQRKPLAGAMAATDGEITVVLDTTLNEELILEGLSREVVSAAQAERKPLALPFQTASPWAGTPKANWPKPLPCTANTSPVKFSRWKLPRTQALKFPKRRAMALPWD